jgi:hypothetical protein
MWFSQVTSGSAMYEGYPKQCPRRLNIYQNASAQSDSGIAGIAPPDLQEFLGCAATCTGPSEVTVEVTHRRWIVIGPVVVSTTTVPQCPMPERALQTP